MRNALFLTLYILSLSLFTDSLRFNVPNNHGSLGVINIPSARFYEESSLSFSAYRGNPDRKINLTFYPYSWLEAGIFYSSFKDEPYGNEIFTQDRKDKGLNVKFLLKEEDDFPAIAIGMRDIGWNWRLFTRIYCCFL